MKTSALQKTVSWELSSDKSQMGRKLSQKIYLIPVNQI